MDSSGSDIEFDFKPKTPASSFFDISKLMNAAKPLIALKRPFDGYSKLPKILGRVPVPLNPQLSDVLDDAFDHPMSLTSFESYLTYIGKVENLYFINWLRDYTLLYEEGVRLTEIGMEPTLICLAKKLKAAYETGLKSFLTVGAPLEIKLAKNTQSQLSTLIESNKPNPLAPATFLPAREEIMIVLEAQFKDFLNVVLGNVGMRTRTAAQMSGFAAIIVGLLPFILAVIYKTVKIIRFIGVPIIYLALLTLICGQNKTCPILLATCKRRTLPWEYLEPSKDLAACEISPMEIDSSDSKHDFSFQLRHYSHLPPPVRAKPFDNLFGPLTSIGNGTAALYYYHQVQMIQRSALYSLLALGLLLIPMAVIP